MGLTLYFQISRFPMDPAEITAAIGVTPSQTFRTGDGFGPNLRLKRRFNAWIVRSRLSETADISEHVADIRSQLQPGWEALVVTCQKFQADLNAVVRFNYDESPPALHLDQNEIQLLSELSAAFDADIYVSVRGLTVGGVEDLTT